MDVAKYLIDKGADLNAKGDHYGITPLHKATGAGLSGGSLDIVKYLVEKGTDFDVRDNNGEAPLHYAAARGMLDIVKYLVEKGANVNATRKNLDTPLHRAAYNGRLDVVKYLTEKGANINAKDEYGDTPLHKAARSSHNLDIVKYLVEKGADVNAKNNDDYTPLGYARKNKGNRGYRNTIEFLEARTSRNHNRRSIGHMTGNQQAINGKGSISSWTNNSIVNWVKGSTEAPALLASREQNNHTVTAAPEINTTVVNSTIMLGILATGLFNKTKHKQPIHENLLSPREQSMRLNNIDENMIIKAIQQGEEKFSGPNTDMDGVKISGNKTGMWKRK